MAKPLIVANWKMHPPTLKAAMALFTATKRLAERSARLSIVVAPPAIYLAQLAARSRGARLAFAGQSAREGGEGAFTGSISMAQLRDAGARYCLVGHAERRAAGESDDDTRRQVASALKHGLAPILCIGERERRASGEHFLFIRAQLRAGLADTDEKAIPRIAIAYEPVWAIGGEEPMSTRQMHEMAIFIRKTIVEVRGTAGQNARILYGGAIDDATARPMLAEGQVQGLLIGRASTDAGEFGRLLDSLANA